VKRLAVWLAGSAALVAAASAAVWQPWSTRPLGDPEDAALVAEGRAVYADRCASCHGAHLEGQANWRRHLSNGRLPAPPHDPSGHTWHHPDEALFVMTKHGLGPYAPPGYESDMPGFDQILTDHQIWAVLAFIKSTWPKDVRERQNRAKLGGGA
jgi:mono/diheme cytochrome c family protein